MKHWTDELAKLKPCEEGLRWARTQPTLAVAWRRCKNEDWMMWLLLEVGVEWDETDCLFRCDPLPGCNCALELDTPEQIRAIYETPTMRDLREAVRRR